MKFVFSAVLNFFALCSILGQADSIKLPVITVSETRSNLYSIGNQKQAFDSSFVTQNTTNSLAELASKHTAIFINSYGPGLLNSSTARGAGSGHTAVLWNGFNIQNNMNGVVDFSLVPIGFFEDITIDYGGTGALFGSGAVGSVIHLSSPKKMRTGWHGNVVLGGGSFGNFTQQMGLDFGTKKTISSIAVINSKAENDFEYIYNNKKGTQRNSAFQQVGLHLDNTFQLSENQLIKTFIWFQNTNRKIAPSATSGDSDATQKDRSFRGGLEYSLFQNDIIFKARAAYFDDYLLFESSLVDSSISYTKTVITELENTFHFSQNHQLNIGFHYTFDHANSNVFEAIKMRNRMALFAIWKARFWKQKGTLVTSLRQEIVDKDLVPLIPSIGSEVTFFKGLQLNTKVSGMFKYPNFNDLFWPQVGNPDLLPESGWNAELGLNFKKTLQKSYLKTQVTGFNSFIDNWILWSPINGIWKPSNQQSIWSRGISAEVAYSKESVNFGWTTALNYQFTKSTIRQPDDQSGTQNIGKQLIYTPLHQVKGSLNFWYQKTKLTYIHSFTGDRFTTKDNSKTVGAYAIGDLSLTQYFVIKKIPFEVNFRVNNLWDKNYVILPARPMPMRNYFVSLKGSF